METLYPASHTFNSNWLMQECNSTIWTREENKKFESALAIFDQETPDRWIMVAAMIPGKSVLDVIEQYKELVSDISDIEAGRVPVPGYLASSFSLGLVKNREFNAFRKRPLAYRTSDHEKKKGVPWTEEEHRRFLMGLQKHGKGDWRSISRNYVFTKTSIQVASHAQKYYLRQQAEGKEKRRPSIHDITTVDVTDATQSGDFKFTTNNKSSATPLQEKAISTPKISLDWNHSDDGSIMVFNSKCNNPFMAYTREIASRGHKLQRVGGRGADLGPLNLGYPFQTTRYQVW